MAYAPTITQYLDAAPCPRVEILFTEFAPGTVSVTVRRTAGGVTNEVRGAVRTKVAGALTRIDFEVPFGVQAEYKAQMFNAAGVSLGWTSPTGVFLDVPDTWLHNPLDPAGSVRVAFRGTAARDISRPLRGELVQPIGRRVGVLISSGRSGVTGVNLDVVTDDLASADRVQAMLGVEGVPRTGVLCFRVGAGDRVRLPKPFFAAVQDIAEVDVNYAIGTGETIAHHMTGTEAAPPAPGVFVPLLTRAHLNAFYATRAAFNSAYGSRLEANRDYGKAQ